jgi:hypothetical protein
VNPQFSWSFNPAFAVPVRPTNGPSLSLSRITDAPLNTVSVTVTADVGISLNASIQIKHVLNPQEIEMVLKICDLRKLISTLALLPPPPPDPEGPIIATVLPTPSEINRLRWTVMRMSRTLDQIAEMNGRLQALIARMK